MKQGLGSALRLQVLFFHSSSCFLLCFSVLLLQEKGLSCDQPTSSVIYIPTSLSIDPSLCRALHVFPSFPGL